MDRNNIPEFTRHRKGGPCRPGAGIRRDARRSYRGRANRAHPPATTVGQLRTSARENVGTIHIQFRRPRTGLIRPLAAAFRCAGSSRSSSARHENKDKRRHQGPCLSSFANDRSYLSNPSDQSELVASFHAMRHAAWNCSRSSCSSTVC